jgi:GNAT superfamily N-acetyltransferase
LVGLLAGVLGQSGGVWLHVLGPGDEEAVERAWRTFGAGRVLDPSGFLARPETTLILAEDGSEVVGWVYGYELVHPGGERTMLLYALDVVEHRRRRGIGKALVTAFVDHARVVGCREVWVLTDDGNPAGVATYCAAGGHRDPVDQVMFIWMITRRYP